MSDQFSLYCRGAPKSQHIVLTLKNALANEYVDAIELDLEICRNCKTPRTPFLFDVLCKPLKKVIAAYLYIKIYQQVPNYIELQQFASKEKFEENKFELLQIIDNQRPLFEE